MNEKDDMHAKIAKSIMEMIEVCPYMEYIGIGICAVSVITICVVLILKSSKNLYMIGGRTKSWTLVRKIDLR